MEVNTSGIGFWFMPLTGDQCRAGRALLRWSQLELSERAGVAKKTVADLELGARQPYERTLDALQAVMEKAGCIFIDEDEGGGDGARLKRKARGRPKKAG